MEVYPDNLKTYKKSAKAQGYKGVRWPKRSVAVLGGDGLMKRVRC